MNLKLSMHLIRSLILAAALMHGVAFAASTQTESPLPDTTVADARVKLTLTEPTSDSSKPVYEALGKNQALPDFIQALNELFIFPRAIEIRAEDCEEGNYPSPSSALPIRLCYGLIRQTALVDNGMSPEAQHSQIVAAALFSVLNYLSPVLASQFDLKIGEEDKSSLAELAGVLALSVGDAIKDDTLEDLARTAQDIAAAEENQEIQPYWVLSGLTKTQAGTIACMIYGSNPTRFSELSVEDDGSGNQDACGAMFSQKMEYWSSLLDAHLKK